MALFPVNEMLRLSIVVLSLTGLWISVYFTGVFYKWFPPHVFWIPRLCQLTKESCLSVLETPRAKIVGIPNSAFGILIYAYLLADQLFFFPPIIGLVFLGFALLRSIYLAYSLIFVTKIPCPLCFTSHGINFLLFLIYFNKILH